MGPVQVIRINEDELKVTVTDVFTEYLDHYVLVMVGNSTPKAIVSTFLQDELSYSENETRSLVEYV